MTPENVSDNAPKPLGEMDRITGVYFDPKKAFADIGARPTWVVPVVLLILIAMAFTYAYSTRIGWDRYVHQIMDASTRVQNMEAAQREQAIIMQRRMAPFTFWAGAILGNPILILIVAAVLLVVCKMTDVALKFKQLFAIVSYAMLPGLLSGILAIVVMFLKNPDDFNIQNPLAFNLAAFLEAPPVTGKFVYSLAKSFDLFTFWIILLEAVGIAAAARKVSFVKAILMVGVPWAIWVLVGSGFSTLF